MSHENPYQSPADIEDDVINAVGGDADFGGIGRVAFVAALAVIEIIEQATTRYWDVGKQVSEIISGISLLLFVWLISRRIKNFGESPWATLWLLVPVVNFLLIARCLVLPPGYSRHQTFDVGAKLALAAFVLLALGVVFYSVYTSFSV